MKAQQETWPNVPSQTWARYALDVWTGAGRVEEVKDNSIERRVFAKHAWAAFVKHGFPIKRLRTWVNVQMPDPGEGYDEGYPHVHADTQALTLVHYLDPGDVPAPLDIFEDDEVVETIYPEAGKTVYMPNGQKHAVRKNQGTKPRVAFIATAYSA